IPVDPNFVINQVGPLVAVLIIGTLVALTLRGLFRSPIGEAIAEGIRLRRRRRWGAEVTDGGETPRVAALEQEVHLLQGQLSELAERLDFAERLLAERRQPKLGPTRG